MATGGTNRVISEQQLKQLIEAAVFTAEQPVTVDQLLSGVLANFSLNRPRVRQAAGSTANDYRDRGIELVEVASGYRFQTRAELAPALVHMWPERAPRYFSRLA